MTRSKVKLTVHYLENYLSQSLHISHINSSYKVDDPIDFEVTNSKVKITGALSVRVVSDHYLDRHSSLSLHISHIYWSYLVNGPYIYILGH
jgi:hypothetical protein